jgi:hypothetical protein
MSIDVCIDTSPSTAPSAEEQPADPRLDREAQGLEEKRELLKRALEADLESLVAEYLEKKMKLQSDFNRKLPDLKGF